MNSGRIGDKRAMNLDQLRSRLRRIEVLRNGWGGLRLLKFYLQYLPDWGHWQRRRRQEKVASVTRPAVCTPSGPLHIVFVTKYARAREFKLAYAARLCGHRVTLIATHVQSSDMVAQHFDAHYGAGSPWQILALLDELHPDVTHLFVLYNNARMLPVLLYAPSPVVYDPYDCLQGMIKPEYQTNRLELEAERICFARADHICARSLEPLYLRRNFGCRMPQSTYFPEYCWHVPVECKARQVSDGERLRVVYCGGVWPEDKYPSQLCGHAQFIEMGRIFGQQGIELHIYPATFPGMASFEDFFQLYLEEEKRNPFFHLHRPVSQLELQQELVQYDAGIFLYGKDISRALGRMTEAKMHYSSANKLFDYIEAGLVVLLHGGKHQTGLVRHYGSVIVPRDLGQVRSSLVDALSKEFQPRQSVLIDCQSPRLDKMYRQVANEAQ